MCSHTESFMTPSRPTTFIRYPYRPSFLTLLRRVQTTSTDSFAVRRANNPPTAYCSFQQHWDPSYDVPVLTMVAACDTKITNVTCTRATYQTIDIQCSVTGTAEQHNCTFPITLPTVSSATDVVHLDLLHAYEFQQNTFSKFGVHLLEPRNPVLVINIFNLAPLSCNELHEYSVLHPQDVDPTNEHHLLGLSANRITTTLKHHHLEHDNMLHLDTTDLLNVGYMLPKSEKSSPTPADISASYYTTTIMENLFINNETIKRPTDQTWTYKSSDDYTPHSYPPPHKHRDSNDLYPQRKPMLFPPGYYKHRKYTFPASSTVHDVLEDFRIVHNIPISHIIKEFAYYYHIIPKRMIQEHIDKPWHLFLNQCCGLQTISSDSKIHPLYNKPHRLANWIDLEKLPFYISTTEQILQEHQDSCSSSQSVTSEK